MNKVFIFALGAAAGSLVTWKILDEKYKAIANNEIASVIEQFKKRDENNEVKMTEHYIEKDELDDTTTEYKHYEKTVMGAECGDMYAEKEQYEEIVTMYADGEKIVEQVKEYTKPYVISPEEFGEYGNKTVSLTYYADFVLTDEDDEIIPDPEAIIGDALEHFGEYEDDSVHVRDENIECDYEILKSEKTFSEVYKEEI